MLTFVLQTVIVILLTLLANITRQTLTSVALAERNTLGVVLAEVKPRQTGVNHLLAQITFVVRGADTSVVVDAIHTGGVILTIVVFTVIGIQFTLLALIPRRTHAAVLSIQSRCEVTRASIGTWQADTGVNRNLTVTTLVAKRAGAVVGACDITHTSAIILTGSCQTGGALGHQIQICWTFALEAIEGGGKQQSVSHVGWSSAAGDARLFKASLHPLRQPAQLTVTV